MFIMYICDICVLLLLLDCYTELLKCLASLCALQLHYIVSDIVVAFKRMSVCLFIALA